MKCLIIAAGKGERLSTRGDSKPLVPLLGLTLIERVILNAKKSGITDFYVVTGYNGKNVRLFLNNLSRERNIKITHIINEEWEKENGVSVLKAEKLLNENFILLMGDHIFNGNILKQLKNEKMQEKEVILAIDYCTDSNRLVDIKDATKVLVDKGKVIDIGKNIIEYNAYDTGIFLCSPSIFTAIKTSINRNNNTSLSGAIKILAEQGKVRAFDIKNSFWIDVDDEKAFQTAENCLIDKLKKPSDGPISKYLNRPLSTKITKYLIKTDITPNQISVFSFILSLISSSIFFLGGYIALLAGGILAQISSIIDGCDGEVARLKYRESNFGGWFDAVLDRYADAFILFGLTYHAFISSGNSILFLFIGFMAIIGSFMNSYTADKYDGLMKERFKSNKGFRIRIGRDVRIFLIFVGAIINQPIWALLLIALLMNIENIRRVVICYKSHKAA
ncbi:NTP transferase domain-containing protein [Candidatus Aerophobetes bacterium]|nr:NTP transferase domain-containing protein [Candidatus Aerophobetes bacterium]